MKITIIGWYGTETIGDRAILAGLFHLFSESYDDLEIRLGCLGTLLSERMLDEDEVFFQECSNHRIQYISLFDSRKKKELDTAISWSDIVAIGGGPLMEIDALYMLLYAFKRAKKLGRKCLVAGCGIGPFKSKELLNVSTQLVDNADIAIFRDKKSQSIYERNTERPKSTVALIDPAAIASQCYIDKHHSIERDNYIAINFREPPISEYDGLSWLNVEFFVSILKSVSNNYDGEIRLVPMHSFSIGGDDRYFLNKVARLSGLDNVFVHNRPLSLEQTMTEYYKASYCIGMRFHAVLLQLFLNGRNFVLDYTDPQNGKIANLLNQLSLMDYYDKRYINFVNRPEIPSFDFSDVHKINIGKKNMELAKSKYISAFMSIL